jgi:hypothetical protein
MFMPAVWHSVHCSGASATRGYLPGPLTAVAVVRPLPCPLPCLTSCVASCSTCCSEKCGGQMPYEAALWHLLHLFFLEDDMGAGYFSQVRGGWRGLASPPGSPSDHLRYLHDSPCCCPFQCSNQNLQIT